MGLNILTDALPCCIHAGGADYPINTDFRVWIKAEQMMADDSLDILEKITAILILCYRELPPNIDDALSGIVEFYNGGSGNASAGHAASSSDRVSKQIYCFEQDAPHIYAAFMAQYGIDLQKADLHWWAFRCLFRNLSEDCRFVKIMEYRCMDIGKVKDPAQKKFYRKMQNVYRLRGNREDEVSGRFAEEIAGLF